MNGMRVMERSRLLCLRQLTYWNSFFPIDFASIHDHLSKVVKELLQLGLSLRIPSCFLDTLEVKFPNDVDRWRRELIKEWMSPSLAFPCWWHLAQALREDLVGRGDIAKAIERKYGMLGKMV